MKKIIIAVVIILIVGCTVLIGNHNHIKKSGEIKGVETNEQR